MDQNERDTLFQRMQVLARQIESIERVAEELSRKLGASVAHAEGENTKAPESSVSDLLDRGQSAANSVEHTITVMASFVGNQRIGEAGPLNARTGAG